MSLCRIYEQELKMTFKIYRTITLCRIYELELERTIKIYQTIL